MKKFNYLISRCTACNRLSDFMSNGQYAIGDTTEYYCVWCGSRTMKIIATNYKHNDIMRKLQEVLPNARFSLHDTDLDKIIVQIEGIVEEPEIIKHKCKTCDTMIPVMNTHCSVLCAAKGADKS